MLCRRQRSRYLRWLEADIYGPATIKQILEGNHVRRGEAAHLVTLQALFALYQKAFSQSSETDYEAIVDLVAQVIDACSTETNEDLVEANMALMHAVDDLDVAQNPSLTKAMRRSPCLK